jgi:hypothetical protein
LKKSISILLLRFAVTLYTLELFLICVYGIVIFDLIEIFET